MFKRTHNNPTYKPLALTLALVLVFCFGNSVQFLQAQPTPTDAPEGAAPEGQENEVCMADMKLYLLDVEPKYRNWMENHFNNKSSSTSLLDDAFARYADYRRNIYDRYATYFPQQGALQLSEGLEPGACLAMVEDSLEKARQTLEQKALSTSTVKRTTALITKYQQINSQMRTLYQSFITMKKHLDTFADKLPCYISKACNKG